MIDLMTLRKWHVADRDVPSVRWDKPSDAANLAAAKVAEGGHSSPHPAKADKLSADDIRHNREWP